MFRCNVEAPTPNQCSQIKICDNNDIADFTGMGICSALEFHSACSPGFMFYDQNKNKPNTSRPMTLIANIQSMSTNTHMYTCSYYFFFINYDI